MSMLSKLLKDVEVALADKLLDPEYVQSVIPELVENGKILYGLDTSFNGEGVFPKIVLMDVNPADDSFLFEDVYTVTVYFKCYSLQPNNFEVYDLTGLLSEVIKSISVPGYDILKIRETDLRFPQTVRGEMDGSDLLRNRAKEQTRVATCKYGLMLLKQYEE